MTQPVHHILNRDPLGRQLAEVLARFANGLEETANFGSIILSQFAGLGTTRRHPIVFAMLLRHYLELLDAVSILVRESSIDPAKLLLRSMLEILFALKYMLESDSELRASSFIVAHVKKVSLEFRKMTPAQVQTYPSWASDLAELESELKYDEHSQALNEYERLSSLGKGNYPWHSYFGGPRTIQDLAKHLNLSELYDTLYRQWSGLLHAQDIFSNRVDSAPEGGTLIVQIRFPRDLQEVTAHAFNMSIELFRVFTEKLLPLRLNEFKAWFRSIHTFGQELNGPGLVSISIT